MISWATFAGAFVLFFATHTIPVRPPVKRYIVKHVGSRGFTAAYSSLSLVMLAFLIWATQRAPYVVLWTEAPWHRSVVWLGMLIACLIVAASIGRPNPFSFGGGTNKVFDPSSPGIVGYFRHPLLVALALWGILHLIVNGDLAHVVLFGTLSLFAILGQRIVDMRKKRDLGAEEWTELLLQTRQQRGVQRLSWGGFKIICAGVIVFLILVALHPIVIGQPVLF